MADPQLLDCALPATLQGFSSLLFLAAAQKLLKRKHRRKRRAWVRNWLANRKQRGAYSQLISELTVDDAHGYRRYLRMDVTPFEVSLSCSMLAGNSFHAQSCVY